MALRAYQPLPGRFEDEGEKPIYNSKCLEYAFKAAPWVDGALTLTVLIAGILGATTGYLTFLPPAAAYALISGGGVLALVNTLDCVREKRIPAAFKKCAKNIEAHASAAPVDYRHSGGFASAPGGGLDPFAASPRQYPYPSYPIDNRVSSGDTPGKPGRTAEGQGGWSSR